MTQSNLLIWGGGHLATLVLARAEIQDYFSQSFVLSRSQGSIEELEKLLNGSERNCFLITRPFREWKSERKNPLVQRTLKVLSDACVNGVMISSTGVYSASEKPHPLREDSALLEDHPYLLAEADLLSTLPSMKVLRAAGLYDSSKGPHQYYLRQGFISGNPKDTLNLIHYKDLAKLVSKMLLEKTHANSKQLWNVSDNNPLRKEEVYKCFQSWGSPWSEVKAPSEKAEIKSQKMIHSSVWKELDLEPEYPSLLSFQPEHDTP